MHIGIVIWHQLLLCDTHTVSEVLTCRGTVGQFHKKVNHVLEIVFGRLVVPLLTAIGTGSPRYLPWVSGR